MVCILFVEEQSAGAFVSRHNYVLGDMYPARDVTFSAHTSRMYPVGHH